MRTQIYLSAEAGSIVRRIREDRGISRSELAKVANISPRTLFAFEQGRNDNIGLATFLRVAKSLGLSVSVDDTETPTSESSSPIAISYPEFHPSWETLGDVWSLDGSRQ